MGLFDRGRKKRDAELRETGTRVPARLVRLKSSAFERNRSDGRMRGRLKIMSFEAETPEGKKIPFTVKADWAPEEGVYLEAACDEAREEAVLMLDIAAYNPTDNTQEEFDTVLRESMEAAQKLRTAKLGRAEAEKEMQAFREERKEAEAARPSLKDLINK